MDKLTPFDKLTSSSELQMMKLLIPYTSPDIRQTLAIFIKFTELRNTLHCFSLFAAQSKPLSPTQIFEEILPYMPENVSEQFEQMKGMMDMMEMMQGQDMSDMFQMFSSDNNDEKGADTDEQLDESSPFSNT